MSIIIDGTGTISGVSATGISSAQTITSVPSSALPAGTVLQVVTTTKTNTTTSSSGSFIDVGLTASITPKSATSKVYILSSVAIGCDTSSANVGMRIRNTTAGTSVSSDPYYISRWPADSQSAYYCQKINFIQQDSPATTSATTYSIQMNTNAGSFQVNMAANTGGGVTNLVSTITLMEIAA